MLLVGSAVLADGARFKQISLPSLDRVLDRDDVVLFSTGDVRGICAVYNDFVREARTRPDAEGLILLHDDVEIIDSNFRAKVLAALDEADVGIVGVVGGAELRSAAWWEGRRTAGRLYETGGSIEVGPPRADVDVVDGLFMAIAPRAFRALQFDERTCPRFHGYDVDYCLQSRAAGLRVVVRPIELLHRTKRGYGDRRSFDETAEALAEKWPTWIRPPTRRQQILALPGLVRAWVRYQERRLKSVVRNVQATSRSLCGFRTPEALVASVEVAPDTRCLACGQQLASTSFRPSAQAVICEACGSGLTWPPPTRDAEGEGIWLEQYGNSRLAHRDNWFSEARKRVEWVQLHVPEGCLLEIGCATGEFCRVAEDEGYDMFGVEPSEWAAEQARALDLAVVTGFLADWRAKYPGVRPDAVCLWHVIEHVPEPLSLLKEIVATLKPGGYLFLEVPNFASSAAARLGAQWQQAQPADHVAHYTPQGLTRLLERAGFELVQLLPITWRIYLSGPSWRRERNAALLEGHDWPPLDFLRGVARSPDTAPE